MPIKFKVGKVPASVFPQPPGYLRSPRDSGLGIAAVLWHSGLH